MREEFDIIDGIKMSVKNHDTSMGHYYHEDDWFIDVIAPDVATAVQEFFEGEFLTSDIRVSYANFSRVKYLIYNGKQIILEEEEFDKDEDQLATFQFNNLPYRVIGYQKRGELKKEEERKNAEKHLVEKTEREMKLLDELKTKYEK